MPSAPPKLRKCAEIFLEDVPSTSSKLLIYKCCDCLGWFSSHFECKTHILREECPSSTSAVDPETSTQEPVECIDQSADMIVEYLTDVLPSEELLREEILPNAVGPVDICFIEEVSNDEDHLSASNSIQYDESIEMKESIQTHQSINQDIAKLEISYQTNSETDDPQYLTSACTSIPKPNQRSPRNSKDPPDQFTLLLLRNLRNKHGPKLLCDICGRTFVTRSRLLVHMSSHYGSHLQCTRCPASFVTYNEIRAHSKTHPRQKFGCDICGAQHLDRRNLEVHIRTHTGEKPYKCDQCPRAFNESYKFKVHMQRHNNDLPYQCELCAKRFVSAGQARNHQRSHMGVKPFACKTCGKSFVSKQGMELHDRLHTGDRPLACPKCDKRFAWSHSLKKHMHVHDAKRQHACEKCNKSFTSLAYLRQHYQKAQHPTGLMGR